MCYHCGSRFTDPFIEALHAALPTDMPMDRHGESGVLVGGEKPELCETCRLLPPAQLGKILGEMIELTLRKYHGGLS